MDRRSRHGRGWALWCCWLSLLLLVACGSSGSGDGEDNNTPPPPEPEPNHNLQGTVRSAEGVVVGAEVAVYAAGGEGYGKGARLLASAATDGNGGFGLNVQCSGIDAPLYVVASAGRVDGAATESRRVLFGLAGNCAAPAANVVVNELTSVAGAYAFARFFDADAAALGAPESNVQGLVNAASLFRRLVNPSSGQTEAEAAEAVGIELPLQRLNTIANAAAVCAGSDHGAQTCDRLLQVATLLTGAMPDHLLLALVELAREPQRSTDAVFELSAIVPHYQPALNQAPEDWLLALRMRGAGLRNPTGVAIDAQGDAWVANFYDGTGAVSKFRSDGTPLSGENGYRGGGLRESLSIAVDPTGNAWISNQETGSDVNQGHGSLTKLASDGSVLSGDHGWTDGGIYFPYAVAVDGEGDVWAANFGNSSLSKLSSNGMPLSPMAGFRGGGLGNPIALAIDELGLVWVSNQGTETVSLFDVAGQAISPADGYGRGELVWPGKICLDAVGDAWVPNRLGDSITRLSGVSNQLGRALSPSGGYSSDELVQPFDCAVDGAGTVWITNFLGNNISRLIPSDISSPEIQRMGAGLLRGPHSLAIDSSGNVWVTNYHDQSVAMLIGAAEPVRVPLSGYPRRP